MTNRFNGKESISNGHGMEECSMPDKSIITDFDDDYQTFAEKLGIGIYIIREGLFGYVNSSLLHTLGYENKDELIGKPFLEIVHPDDKDRILLQMRAEEGRSTSHRFICRVFKKDGPITWIHMSGKNTTQNEKPVNIGHLIDFTPVQEMKKTMYGLLERYKNIINEVGDAVGETDLKGNITFTNNTSSRIWGMTLDELIGKNFRSYMDEKTADYVYHEYNKVFTTGIPGKNIIYEVIRKDGERRLIEDSVSLIRDEEGKKIGFRTISRDITDRKKTENELVQHRTHLEAIFRSVKDAIITVDPELRVITLNDSSETICALNRNNSIGKILPDCLSQCSKSCCDVLRETLHKKTTIKEYHIECKKQKTHQMVSVNSSPLLNKDGNFMGAVLVIRDITLIRDLERELRDRHQFQNIIGKSKKMQETYELLEDLANLDTTVLVTGESGTGKELIARALHFGGNRALRSFVSVNCSALTESLLESELFGHVKGAFTGAIKDKKGRFEMAEGGTILLDEIGDISPLIQLKLLRVLQEKEFERVGESTPLKVDVRVIACTNKDLKERVSQGLFREDLYYRLKVMEINIPPLRERIDDLPLLVNHFCTLFNKQFKKNIQGVSGEALRILMEYYWPGNIRELEHAIERAYILCQDNHISIDHLPDELKSNEGPGVNKNINPPKEEPDQAQVILDALVKAQWNKTKAASILGISRRTMYRKIQQYNLDSKISN